MQDRQKSWNQGWDLKFFGYAVIMLASYIVSARLSYQFTTAYQFLPLLWPPTGIAFTAVALGGYRFAGIAALGSFIVMLMLHEPLPVAYGIALSTLLGLLAGGYILKQLDFNPLLSRLQDALSLVSAALVLSAVNSAATTATFYAVHLAATEEDLKTILTTRWVSEALSVLIITPFLVRWLPHPLFRFKRTRQQLVEFFGSLGTLVVLNIAAYWTPFTSVGPLPMIYLMVIPLMWIALRVGPRAMTLAIFLNGAIAISDTISTQVSGNISPDELLPFQVLFGVISVLFLILVGIEEERKEGRLKLQEHVEELQSALQQIDSEDKSKNEFIAILAHELRNPLAPVLSALEFLKFQEPEKERLKMLEGAVGQVEVMGRLLDDLLDVARMTQKKFRLKREPVTLKQSVDQSVRMTEPFIRTRGHQFTISLPEETLWLHADATRLTQIFSNLLFNAAKYTEPGGRIALSAEREDDMVTLCVKDTGIGIAPDMLERIFEPFVQYRHSGEIGSGLGLGLSLAKRLVEMHGGTIGVESEGLGKGSTFCVRLPLSKIVNTLPLPMEQAPPRTRTRGIRILVVDDNKPAAEGLAKLLQLRGQHTVGIAYTGKEALLKTAQFKPHVIILDIGLPDLSGYEVAERLRKEQVYAHKLIALTGYGQEDDKRKALEAGFNHHLTKPVGILDIERLLEKCMNDAGEEHEAKRGVFSV